jgi:hypothetical protein
MGGLGAGRARQPRIAADRLSQSPDSQPASGTAVDVSTRNRVTAPIASG